MVPPKKQRQKQKQNINTNEVPVKALWAATEMAISCCKARGYQFDIKRFQTDFTLFQEYVLLNKDDTSYLNLRILAQDFGLNKHKKSMDKHQHDDKDKAKAKPYKLICCCFIPNIQINKKIAVQLLDEFTNMNISRLIIFWLQPASPAAVKLLQAHFKLDIWSYFIAQSRFYNCIQTCAHRPLTATQAARFYKQYHLKPGQISSHMKVDTAMARFLGVNVGDVVKIHRITNEGISFAYRLVVKI